MTVKVYIWGVLPRGASCSYLAMFNALLLPNYIREQTQFFRDANKFAKYRKKASPM